MTSTTPTAGGWRPRGPAPSGMPVRRWIEEEMAAAIRAGDLAPGVRLPSVRRLAERLGVHRNTVRAAYRKLAESGLVRLVQGAGSFVRGGADRVGSGTGRTRSDARPVVGRNGSGTDAGTAVLRRRATPSPSILRDFLAASRSRGVTTEEIVRWFRGWERAAGSGRLLVAAPEPELGRIWAEELSAGLAASGVEVSAVRPAELGGTALTRAPVAVPLGLWDELAGVLPPWVEIVPLTRVPGRSLRRTVGALRRNALVVVVSGSPELRERLLRLVRCVDPPPVAAALPPEETGRLERLVRVARLVVTDVVSARTEARLVGDRRHVVFRDLAAATVRDVERRLLPSEP